MTVSRVDAASRLIKASPDALYAAFVDGEAMAAWRPPEGMRGRVLAFDARPGGVYRMAFEYPPEQADHGKSADGADVFEGRFVDLVPGRKVVERVEFESDDPAFAGTMTVTSTFAPANGGTQVTFACSDVPPGISAADHEAGIASSLANLAAFVERA